MSAERRIILYDRFCSLCNDSVRFIERRDKQHIFSFLSLSSPEGVALLEEQALPTGDNDSVVYIRGDNSYLRSTAILHIFKDLGGSTRILYPFIIIPESARDFIYRVIANNRHRLPGRCQWCNK